MAETLKMVVDGLWRQGRNNLAVRLVAEEGGELPAWQPGAHIDLHLAPGLSRPYSLTGEPATRHYLICVARDAQSRGGSHYIHQQLRPGQTLTVSPPRNLFPLHSAGQVVLLAAGIGITPLWAMLHQLEAQGTPFALHYFVRERADAAFSEALTQPWQHGSCTLHVSSEGHSPRHTLPAALRNPAADSRLYLCGPEGFMQAMQAAAQTQGWAAARIHTEAFCPPAAPASASEQSGFRVTLAASGQSWPVPAGQTIARVLLAAGVEVPLSCEMGICGACLTPVVAGEVDHQDSVQSASEKSAAQQFIALCCSRSRSAELVIDLRQS